MATKIDLPLKHNTLYHGDCLDIMREWVLTNPGCVDLIYLDPPFNSNANYNILYGKDQTNKPRDERAQFVAFKDTWYWGVEAAERVKSIKRATAHPAYKAIRGLDEMLPKGGMLAYLSYMAERLAMMRDLLKDTGSIYLHCDPTASHYLKTIMDAIFGANNFRNEIIWSYPASPSTVKKDFPRKHDTLLRYTKSGDYVFNANDIRIPYSESSMNRMKYAANKSTVLHGTEIKLHEGGKIPPTVWSDIQQTYRYRTEALGYPTQKPLKLLERIIRASSNNGDLVLDPFCGCGTTAEAAWKIRRKFIGIDISPFAVTRVCKERLKKARGVSVMGLPADMKSARDLAKTDPFVFEHWAVSCLEGFAPNDKQTGDGGIDGRGHLLNPPADKNGQQEKGLCVAQVKGGNFTPADLRAFLSQIASGYASMGVFITLEKQRTTPTMREVVGTAGTFQPQGGTKTYDRITFWSIQEYFDDIEAKLPEMTHPFTGKPLVQREIPSN